MSKVPCGGFKLDENFLGMNENDELSLTGGSEGRAYQYLVTDGNGKTKWEDRLAYEYTEWKDFVLNNDGIAIDGFTMPPVGDTVAVKVNGVESVETVKLGEMEGLSYPYIGSINFSEFLNGKNGWLISPEGDTLIVGVSNPTTTVSLYTVMPHKIAYNYLPNDLLKSSYPIKIVNFDDFLHSFGIEATVGGDGKVGTNNFSLSKEKWDEFLNLVDEFANNTLCVSHSSWIVENVKSNVGHPIFYSTGWGLSAANILIFKYYKLDVSYNEETETVTTIKSITEKDLT